MSFNYTGLASIATTLVAKFGKDLTFYHSVKTQDDAQPWKVTDESTSETVKGVETEIDEREFNGDTIRLGDVRYLLSRSLTSSPKPGDIVEDGSRQARVTIANRIAPGPTVMAYEVTCRI